MARKQSLAEIEIEETVALFAALAHPVRLRILVEIGDSEALSVSELMTRLGTEQSALSHQLAILRDARMVRSTVDGRRRLYSLADDHVAHIVHDAVMHARERSSVP